jgi:hypothetical protein
MVRRHRHPPSASPRARRRSDTPVASALHFDATVAEVQAFALGRGWTQPGTRLAVYQGELVYSADGWRSTHTAALRYLTRTEQGFVLDDLDPGTAIAYAVHVFLGASTDGFYSFFDKAEVWINNGGKNLAGVTGTVPASAQT